MKRFRQIAAAALAAGLVSVTATPLLAAPDAATTIPTKNLLDALKDGGLLMIPIGVCSFILCVFVFERAVSRSREPVVASNV